MKWLIQTASLLALGLVPRSEAARPPRPGGSDPCAGQKVSGLPSARHLGEAVAMQGATSVLGAPKTTSPPGNSSGAAWIYGFEGGLWQQQGHLVPTGLQPFDAFGESVAISGERVLIGASHHDPGGAPGAGAAWIFERQGGVWLEMAKLVASDAHPSDRFGVSVALDGDTAVIGANEHPQGGFVSGAAYVFERVGGTWVETQRLASSNIDAGDFFGWSVAIEGDWLVVGAVSANGVTASTGAAYVFRRTPGGWIETDKLEAFDGEQTDYFGYDVAISGERIAVGATSDDDIDSVSGALYVFEYDGTSWAFSQKLKAPDPDLSSGTDRLGSSVDLEGDQLLAGAPTNPDPIQSGVHGRHLADHLSGSAYLFQHDGSAFVFSRKLRAPDADYDHRFGESVALSNGIALIGTPHDDEGCPTKANCEAGAAWFFPAPAFTLGYCFGEDCPCANHDAARGCARHGGRGATLTACGSASVALDDLALRAENLAPGQPALLVRGLQRANGGAGLSFGDGLRCVGGGTARLGLAHADDMGIASWGPGLAALGGWQPGDTMRFQVWFRDELPSPCGNGYNATSALEAVFGP
jgi:hypothetical protein